MSKRGLELQAADTPLGRAERTLGPTVAVTVTFPMGRSLRHTETIAQKWVRLRQKPQA